MFYSVGLFVYYDLLWLVNMSANIGLWKQQYTIPAAVLINTYTFFKLGVLTPLTSYVLLYYYRSKTPFCPDSLRSAWKKSYRGRELNVTFAVCSFCSISQQVNVGKMDSPIEKWNLIIGNLALKQVHTLPKTHPVQLSSERCIQYYFQFFRDQLIFQLLN